MCQKWRFCVFSSANFRTFFYSRSWWGLANGSNHSGPSLRIGKWTLLTGSKSSDMPQVGNMGAYWKKYIYVFQRCAKNGDFVCFHVFFGTFWAITWPITAWWPWKLQATCLMHTWCHSDARNDLGGCISLPVAHRSVLLARAWVPNDVFLAVFGLYLAQYMPDRPQTFRKLVSCIVGVIWMLEATWLGVHRYR